MYYKLCGPIPLLRWLWLYTHRLRFLEQDPEALLLLPLPTHSKPVSHKLRKFSPRSHPDHQEASKGVEGGEQPKPSLDECKAYLELDTV